MDNAMKRHDSLAGASRTRHAGRAVEIASHQGALSRMQKDRPLLPRGVQCAFELLAIADSAEATLRIGMSESRLFHLRRLYFCRLRRFRCLCGPDTCSKCQNGLARLLWQIAHQ